MEDNMNITTAQYQADMEGNNSCIKASIDGQELSVPLAVGNRHYDEILKQVDAGTLTIEDAD
tara:strand:+ start:481 stop:666 length:186 start_codon:yes stop_codon:yes gene_type:complete